jgi:RimJ/RimL family protein N-acetyltransferase
MLFYEQSLPIGAGTFTEIDESSRTARWGFYTAPAAPKGGGTRMCTALLDYAFDKLPIDTIYGVVLMTNQASIRLHEKLGFTVDDGQTRFSQEPLRSDVKWMHISRGRWTTDLSRNCMTGNS